MAYVVHVLSSVFFFVQATFWFYFGAPFLPAQLNAIKEQVDEVKQEQQDQAQQRQRAQQRLQRLEDAKLQRLQALEDRHRGITQAWQWLQQGQVGELVGASLTAGTAQQVLGKARL